jgi:hypothetical protein
MVQKSHEVFVIGGGNAGISVAAQATLVDVSTEEARSAVAVLEPHPHGSRVNTDAKKGPPAWNVLCGTRDISVVQMTSDAAATSEMAPSLEKTLDLIRRELWEGHDDLTLDQSEVGGQVLSRGEFQRVRPDGLPSTSGSGEALGAGSRPSRLRSAQFLARDGLPRVPRRRESLRSSNRAHYNCELGQTLALSVTSAGRRILAPQRKRADFTSDKYAEDRQG